MFIIEASNSPIDETLSTHSILPDFNLCKKCTHFNYAGSYIYCMCYSKAIGQAKAAELYATSGLGCGQSWDGQIMGRIEVQNNEAASVTRQAIVLPDECPYKLEYLVDSTLGDGS